MIIFRCRNVITACLLAVWLQAASGEIDNDGFRTKGHVARGDLADYVRGPIDLEALLENYHSYRLPLPKKGSELVQFPREIWSAEGPMRVWHLGFVLPEDPGSKAMRFLVGGEIFIGRENTFFSADTIRPDGTIEKAEQFVPDKLVERWDGTDLDKVDFIFHGQESRDLDSNALLITALQLHHLGDKRAAHLMNQSLRFDEDHYLVWVSDFYQPAGWTPRQILAECAWRIWVNRWLRRDNTTETTVAMLQRIHPDLPKSRQKSAIALLDSIDPDLAVAAGDRDRSLESAVIDFGIEGGDWEALVQRAKQDPKAFDRLLEMLGDQRILPTKNRSEEIFTRRADDGTYLYRAWYPRDRLRRVSDYAGMLLDELCDRELVRVNSTVDEKFLRQYAARAKFWRRAASQEDRAAYIRQHWFVNEPGGKVRINLPAIELQAVIDFETLAEELPKEIGKVSAHELANLSRVISGAAYNPDPKIARKEWAKRRARATALFKELYKAGRDNDPEVRAVLLRMALPYDDEELRDEAMEWIRQGPKLAAAEAAGVAEILTRTRDFELWDAFLEATREAEAAVAIDWIGRVLKEKDYSDHISRQQQIRFGFALLDDERQHGAWRVGNHVARHLGRKLGLPWRPSADSNQAEWALYRERVRAAILRLDALTFRGLIKPR